MQPMHLKELCSMYEPLIVAANKTSVLMDAPSTALYKAVICASRPAVQTQMGHHGKAPIERAGR